MKKSKIAKLALMGASITALAATLTTSTYAWYVSNKTAKVAASTGSTAAASADGSITLSLTGAYGTFYNEITLGDFNNAGLLPVVTADGKTFYSLTESTANHTATPTAAATVATVGGNNPSDLAAAKVYKYEFYIMSDADVSVNPLISITNITSTYTGQQNYTGSVTYTVKPVTSDTFVTDGSLYTRSGAGTTDDPYTYAAVTSGSFDANATYYKKSGSENCVGGVGAGATFYENALNAMSLSFWSTASSTQISSSATTGTYGSNALTGFLALTAGSNTTYVTNATTTAVTTPVATSGANDYYEAVSGNTLTDATSPAVSATTPFTSNTAFGQLKLYAGKPVKLEYYLWLDGADDQCFNCCEQQDFSVAFTYTVA